MSSVGSFLGGRQIQERRCIVSEFGDATGGGLAAPALGFGAGASAASRHLELVWRERSGGVISVRYGRGEVRGITWQAIAGAVAVSLDRYVVR